MTDRLDTFIASLDGVAKTFISSHSNKTALRPPLWPSA